MELEVVSNPDWGVGGVRGVGLDRFDELGRYDEEMVKPALLLADKVTLRTWRLDMQLGARIAATATRLAVPLAGTVYRVVYGESGERERRMLGIDEQLTRHLRLLIDQYGGDERSPMPRDEFFESEALDEFVGAYLSYWRKYHKGLRAESLRALVDRGLLSEEPWDDRDLGGMAYPDVRHAHFAEALAHGFGRMLADLETGEAGFVLDRGLDTVLRGRDVGVQQASTLVLENASNLLRIVDGLTEAPVDEIVDIREELGEYLRPFRSFIFSHAQDVNVAPDMTLAERRRQAEIKWQADVSPAIDELRAAVERQSFVRNALRVSAEGPESAIGIGLGLTTAMASGALGVTALAGLGVAALPTIIKAASASIQARATNRRNGAYFVLEVERRLGRRATA